MARSVGVELTLREARRFEMEELALATKNFSDRSLIGEGKFGAVYKGLLNDGMLVAIKKRAATPSQEFIEEVMFPFLSNGEKYSHYNGWLVFLKELMQKLFAFDLGFWTHPALSMFYL